MAGRREFSYQDDRSDKFWTVEVSGSEVVTTYGRRGSAPRETRTECRSPDAAERECARLVAEKLRKGYVERPMSETEPRTPPDWAAMTMSEEVFWRLIALLDWRKGEDEEAVALPAVGALAKMGPEQAMRFQDILAEKLFALDTVEHARHIGEFRYAEGSYLSPDGFLYARCRAVAKGRANYEKTLADPRAMPKDLDFETLLYLAPMAYEEATGEEWDYDPPVSFETYSNRAGWAGAADVG